MAGHVVTNDPKNLCQTPAASAPASAYAFCAVPAFAARWDDDEHQPASQPPPGNSFSTARSCLPILNARNIDLQCWICFPRFFLAFRVVVFGFVAAANQSAFDETRRECVRAFHPAFGTKLQTFDIGEGWLYPILMVKRETYCLLCVCVCVCRPKVSRPPVHAPSTHRTNCIFTIR